MGSCLDVTLCWEGDVVEVRRLQRETALTIGNDDDDLFVPMPAGTRSHRLLVRDHADARWTLQLAPGMHGRALFDDGAVALSDLTSVLPDGGRELVLEAPLRLEVSVGAFRLELSPTSAHAPAIVPFELDRPLAHSALPTGTFMTALVAWFLLTPAPLQASPVLENPQSFARVLVAPARPQARASAPLTTSAPGREVSPQRVPRAHTQRERSKRSRDAGSRAQNAVFAALAEFGARAEQTTGGGQLASALAGVTRATSGSAVGGVSLRGTPGGGGNGGETYRLAGIAMRGGGDALHDNGKGGLGGHGERDVRVTVDAGEPVGCNAACAAIIRRVVREKSDSVRHCYERALQRTPGLTGRVAIRWTLSAGRVRGASVANDDVGAGVGACIARQISTWRFPALAGDFIVTYPWVFRSR